MQRLQNRAARAVTNILDYDISVHSIVSDLKWMNIEQRCFYLTGVFMYKCLHGLSPNYLSCMFCYVSQAGSCETRSVSNMLLKVPRPHTSLYMNSLSYKGASLWNTLPKDVKDSVSLHTFKAKLKALVSNM